VPQSQEKTPEQTTELPNPELNPLLNPTLGRHLGRWAQVYFTSPPEKREEAVEELLRELKGTPPDSSADTAAVPDEHPRPESPSSLETIRIVEAVTDPQVQQCAQCGQPYITPQRFCGMCGAALEGEEQRVSSETIPQYPVKRTLEPIFSHADLPSLSPVRESVNPPNDDFSDIRWLREKAFAGDEGSAWRRARYAPALIALLAIGILFYAQSRPPKTTGPPPAKTTPSATETPKVSTPPVAPSAAENAPTEKPTEPPPVSPRASSSDLPKTTAPAPATAAPAVENRRPPIDSTPAVAGKDEPASELNPENGAAELAMAEDFLNGKTHPRSSETAAKYLWRAVGKENPTAILLLSNMYLAGDGVPRSCDQARLLLSAAAKKGVPQAAERLGSLLRSGCPK
jgi:hypothetical protein